MHILTFKAKPKMIFGVILALTGIIVIVLTFVGNHHADNSEQASANIDCSSDQCRSDYLLSLGWEFEQEYRQKDITVPKEFNDVYREYNAIQKSQGFNLENYKGKTATIYTYKITNYGDDSVIIADLMVYDGKLIASDLCNPDAQDGFLVGLTENENSKT